MDNTSQFELRAHHLLCAICAARGAQRPPCGNDIADAVRAVIRSDFFVQIKLTADLDIVQAHYDDISTDNTDRLPRDFEVRRDDYTNRAKDLELLARLDIRPNTVHPAIDVMRILFGNVESLEGICYHSGEAVQGWQECEYAREDLYKQARDECGERWKSMDFCWEMGEDMLGSGPYVLLPIRSKEEVRKAKAESCERIRKADRLFIRPHHLLCLMCHYAANGLSSPLKVDNLHEILVKMADNPDIPVTLNEGCCMVCDPCPAYDPKKHMCFWIYTRDQLKDLRVLRKLGLKPGASLTARELYQMVADKIGSPQEICETGMQTSGSYVWSVCRGADTQQYRTAISSYLEILDQSNAD